VSGEGGHRLAGGRVPQPSRVVVGAGQKAGGVGRECDGAYVIRVSGEGGNGLAGGRLPEPRRVIPGAGQDARAVG
jgi:hypothetical protein